MKNAKIIFAAIFLFASATVSAQVGSIFDSVWPTATTAAPTFSIGASTPLPMYTSVTLSSATSGSEVCYTIDGSMPTANSQGACTNGLTAATYVMMPTADTITFNAIATSPNNLNSAISSITYIIDHTIPVYRGGTEVPEQKSSAASVTSDALTVSTGQLLYVFCKSDTAASIAISDSASDAFTLLSPIQKSYTGEIVQTGYTFTAGSGKVTFTCTPASAATNQLMMVLQYYPGNLTGIDSQVSQVSAQASSWTSSAISTSAKGLIIACATELGYGTLSAGTIGAQTATSRQISGWGSDGYALCEEAVTNPSYPVQTNITASMSVSSSGYWLSTVGAFK